jgi:hypothetical protein
MGFTIGSEGTVSPGIRETCDGEAPEKKVLEVISRKVCNRLERLLQRFERCR